MKLVRYQLSGFFCPLESRGRTLAQASDGGCGRLHPLRCLTKPIVLAWIDHG